VRIPARFAGPPDMANGGVIAATLAGHGPAEVTIRRPVPVEAHLSVVDGRLVQGEEVLAEARALGWDEADALEELAREAPRVSFDAAREAAARTPLVEHHPFPTCFGCGPRSEDGIHCLAGPVDDGAWAVSWEPEEGSPRFVWAALDCPSSAPVVTPGGPPHLLGRIAGRILAPVVARAPHVVVSWPLGEEGRRKQSASVLLGPDGEPRAVARATWIALRSS
jgi:hypothetical protein